MRLLFVGDVYGRPGREAVASLVPQLRRSHGLDVVVVNCENAAQGRGITPDLARQMLDGGIDVLTGGNHIWHHRSLNAFMEEEPRLVRPANYPNAPGRGSYRLRLSKGRTLGVIQVEGRVFMRNLNCPFEAVLKELDKLGACSAYFVDVHAEATSEKQALAWHLAGRVAAVIGTHTHVPTADERILPGGTAYLTDAGMTGPYHSVIGMDVDAAVQRFLTQRQGGHAVAEQDVRLCGAIVDIDAATGRATHIERVHIPYSHRAVA